MRFATHTVPLCIREFITIYPQNLLQMLLPDSTCSADSVFPNKIRPKQSNLHNNNNNTVIIITIILLILIIIRLISPAIAIEKQNKKETKMPN